MSLIEDEGEMMVVLLQFLPACATFIKIKTLMGITSRLLEPHPHPQGGEQRKN